jgi:hypothetical protein
MAPREFRRPRPGEQPTQGGDDELLDDPPTLSQAWSLQAYAAGSRVRRWVFGTLIGGVIGAGVAGYWYVGYLQEKQRHPRPEYVVDPSTVDADSRVLVWSEGRARLGLYRDPPGVRAIVLPDRTITLADDCDHAQVNVDVRGGETVKIAVLVGRVKQQEHVDRAAPPAEPATAP